MLRVGNAEGERVRGEGMWVGGLLLMRAARARRTMFMRTQTDERALTYLNRRLRPVVFSMKMSAKACLVVGASTRAASSSAPSAICSCRAASPPALLEKAGQRASEGQNDESAGGRGVAEGRETCANANHEVWLFGVTARRRIAPRCVSSLPFVRVRHGASSHRPPRRPGDEGGWSAPRGDSSGGGDCCNC